MKTLSLSWPFWALLSAGFAALTAILGKLVVEAVNAKLATFIRTIIIVLAAGVVVLASNSWQVPSAISGRSWLFLGEKLSIPNWLGISLIVSCAVLVAWRS